MNQHVGNNAFDSEATATGTAAMLHPGKAPDPDKDPAAHAEWSQRHQAWKAERNRRLRDELVWTGTERPQLIPNAANVVAMLRWHPDWHQTLAFDEFRCEPQLLRPIPGTGDGGVVHKPRMLTDEDVTKAQVWLQKHVMPRIGREAVATAIQLVCKENGYDPLKDHVQACQRNWDGVLRLGKMFADYFVAADQNAYTEALGRIALMTLVLRAVEPGAFQKMMPILEGPQDIGKSTGLAALCPSPEWFADDLKEIGSKDASSYLRGKFLVEIAELAATKRADIDDLKSFLTRRVEVFRPAYGRHEVEEPRRCMFWGTTNRSDYLRDETGSCRFYPVRITRVDIDAILRDRDQLLGEALACLKEAQAKDEEWWRLSDEALIILESLRESRTDDHPWTSIVINYVEGLSEVAIPMILENQGEPKEGKMRPGLNVDKQHRTRGMSNAVAGILNRHGWVRDGQFTNGPNKGQARYVPAQDPE